MKKTTILALLIMLIPSFTVAGQIYGNIQRGNRPLGRGVPVEIRIHDGEQVRTYSTRTDRYGSYSIYVREEGECTLTLRGTRSSTSIEIRSYRSSVRYDLVLYRRDGEWHLRRR